MFAVLFVVFVYISLFSTFVYHFCLLLWMISQFLGDDRYTIEDGPHGGLGGIPFTDGSGVNRNGYITAFEIRAKSEIDAIRAK